MLVSASALEVGVAGEVARGRNEPDALAQLAQAPVQAVLVDARWIAQKSHHRIAPERPLERGHEGLCKDGLRGEQAAAETRAAGKPLQCGIAHGMD